MSGRPERLSIIVPVYNEARTIRAVIDRLLTIDLPVPREILIVDDGSTDGTGDALDKAVGEGLAVTIVHMPQNRGKGWRSARGLARAARNDRRHPGCRSRARSGTAGAGSCGRSSGAERMPSTGRGFSPARRACRALHRRRTARSPWRRICFMVVDDRYGDLLQDHARRHSALVKLTANRFDIEPEITAACSTAATASSNGP